MPTKIELNADVHTLSWPAAFRRLLDEQAVESFSDLYRKCEAWKVSPPPSGSGYSAAVRRLISARKNRTQEVTCDCGSLLILYVKYHVKACPECGAKAKPLALTEGLHKLYPELVSE